MLDGDMKDGAISVSVAAGGINRITTAKEVVDEMAPTFH